MSHSKRHGNQTNSRCGVGSGLGEGAQALVDRTSQVRAGKVLCLVLGNTGNLWNGTKHLNQGLKHIVKRAIGGYEPPSSCVVLQVARYT